ncbi:hypothetical protein B7494_g5849 [Chlorociboria aeruginascens]|nr:hypothetical protein B7494_g5849 [Chlorociboria aeruginascens]
MISIRAFARSAPRTVSRLTSSTIRRPAARSTILLQSAWKPARTQHFAAFSTSTSRRAGEGDAELVAKLESEITLEKRLHENQSPPTSISDYLENGPFKITDTVGSEEVILTRTFGDEKIRISFSIADLNSYDAESDFPDRALGDEEDQDGANQEDKQASEDAAAEADGEEVEPEEIAFEARASIVIEKPGKGALSIETTAQNGQIIIDNVYYYADATHATAKTAEKALERMNKYLGPPFANLDEDLQILIDRYLDERGINSALAVFIPDYIDMKEQKEYTTWLSNVKGFVAA